jgi:hypothetical protein
MFAESHQTSTLEVSRQTRSVRFRLTAGWLTVIIKRSPRAEMRKFNRLQKNHKGE